MGLESRLPEVRIMPEQRLATISFERPKTDALGFPPSLILVDGQPVGRLRRGRPLVFSVAAGNHLLTVWPGTLSGKPVDPNGFWAQLAEEPVASIRLQVEPGGSARLLCRSNQPRLPLLLWVSGCSIILFVALGEAKRYLPAVNWMHEVLCIPIFATFAIALLFGLIGGVTWFLRAYQARAFRGTVVSLTLISAENVWVTPA